MKTFAGRVVYDRALHPFTFKDIGRILLKETNSMPYTDQLSDLEKQHIRFVYRMAFAAYRNAGFIQNTEQQVLMPYDPSTDGVYQALNAITTALREIVPDEFPVAGQLLALASWIQSTTLQLLSE